MKILVAEDERATRTRILAYLKEWGHEGVGVSDGEEAWRLFQEGEFSFVISDWMMPKMDGIDLVRRLRESQTNESFLYTILLTSRAEKADVVQGIEAGADDFVSKPFDKDELRVRIQAGQRILELEHALAEKNRKLELVNREITEANDRMKESLSSAASIQRSFLPEKTYCPERASFAWRYEPCTELAGDILGVIPLDDDHLGIYVIDVSGHGVPAALLSVHLSRILTRVQGSDAVVTKRLNGDDDAKPVPEEPSRIVEQLNRRFAYSPDTQQYFTMMYGILDLPAREFRYTSAGHPGPIVISGGKAKVHPPMPPAVGFFPDGKFQEATLKFEHGDRLCLYTDGIYEITNAAGEEFGEQRLAAVLQDTGAVALEGSIDSIMQAARDWNEASAFPDDVSVIAVDFV